LVGKEADVRRSPIRRSAMVMGVLSVAAMVVACLPLPRERR
jgi:hypothetical protein